MRDDVATDMRPGAPHLPRPQDLKIAAAPPRATGRAGRVETALRLLDAVRHPRPGTGTIGPARMAMHFLRCVPHLETFRDWLGHAAHPALRKEIDARPYLLTCVVHPYLNSAWPAQHRLAVIAAHYAALAGCCTLLRGALPARLADADQGLRFELDLPGPFEHEGESTLHLRRGAQDLYALAFTLGEIAGQRVAYVGALQGRRSPDALDTYRRLTHQWQGLRPRDLLLAAFRRLALTLGVTRILAVDNAHRVSSNAYFAASGQVRSSYDEVWAECGGAPVEGGFFELAPQAVRREDGAVPARKRALYRRRYEMLDDLHAQIDAAVAAVGACSPANRSAASICLR